MTSQHEKQLARGLWTFSWPAWCCLFCLAGCADDTPPVISDTQSDLGHDHRHIHGQGHDHEHEHSDFSGAHDHEHEHGHRHGKPLFGGTIFPIGHSHHQDGADHFHAEVLPLREGCISLHVLIERDGKFEPISVDSNEILAYAGEPDAAPAMAREVQLTAASDAEGSSEFQFEVPDFLREKQLIEVVIPKIVLGGERHSFSFQAHPSGASARGAEPSDSAKDESPGDEAS